MDAGKLKEEYPNYEDQICYTQTVEQKKAETSDPSTVLPDRIAPFLPFELYTHQAEALKYLEKDKNVCITTSTSSGKTFVYALDIARKYIKNSSSTSLLVYPTKALARDQKEELEDFYNKLDLEIEIGVYDGDVERKEKERVLEESDIIITNFAGLNYYLPYHENWSRFFRNIETLVIDEAHMYTGIQGMHTAWIIRRLLRIIRSKHYASDPQLILTSATIGNPAEHAKNLTGSDVKVVSKDGSPHGKRDIVVWNPPTYYDSNEGGVRRKSSHREASRVCAHLVDKGNQVLLFTPSRQVTELCAKWVEEELIEEHFQHRKTVEPYHAGHTKQERRELEEKLKNGEVDAVVTTSALEVGIDVGSVDATVLDGYPGSRMSFWQQLGRSGRSGKSSITVMVAQNSSIDQYITSQPEYLFEEEVENAVIDLENEDIYTKHLITAARELPLRNADKKYFPKTLEEKIDEYKKQGILEGTLKNGVEYIEGGRPEARINIYATGNTTYDIIIHPNNGEQFELPQVDESRAFREFHKGAIYIHKGQKYQVTSLNTRNKTAHLRPTNASYRTKANREVKIVNIEAEHTYQHPNGMKIHKGTGTIQEHYPTYARVHDTGNTEGGFDTGVSKPIKIHTDMIWLEIEDDLWNSLTQVSEGPTLGALHAGEHGIISMVPTKLTTDPANIGGISMNNHPDTGKPTIFIYDGVDGGIGLTHAMYHELGPLAKATKERIEDCACTGSTGCPACVMSPMCGSGNEPLDTKGASHLMETIYQINS